MQVSKERLVKQLCAPLDYKSALVLLGSRLPAAARTGSAGLLAGCRMDLPVHAALYTNKENAESLAKFN
jgi:hypothetical protein